MNCESCGIEIPPQWVNALKTNICPSCGQAIMSTELQELIAGLSVAVEKMQYNPQTIACWITSNYKSTKIAEYDPTELKTIKPVQNTIQETPNRLEQFFKNADVDLSALPELSAKKKANKIPPTIKQIDENETIVEEENDYIPDATDKMILEGGGGSPLSEAEKDAIAEMVRSEKFGPERQHPAFSAMAEASEQRKENIASGVGATDRHGRPAGFSRA